MKKKAEIKNWSKTGDQYLYLILIENLFLKFYQKELKTLPSLISSNQTAYVDKKIISEGGRFIFDILDIKDILKTKGWPLAADIEKLFDSFDRQFWIIVLKIFGVEKKLVRWIKILLKKQQPCLINPIQDGGWGAKTPCHFFPNNFYKCGN